MFAYANYSQDTAKIQISNQIGVVVIIIPDTKQAVVFQ